MFAVTTLLAVVFAYPVISSGELLRRQLDLSAVPACGQTCLITAATNPEIVGSCSLTDVACLCKDEKLMSSVQSCALSSCSPPDQVKLLTFATKMCPGMSSPAAAPSAPAPSLPSGAASELAGLPACGQNCVVDTATNSAIAGSCSLSDIGCLCKNSEFTGTVTTCVASKCSLDEKLTMLNWSTTTCTAGGAKDSATASVTTTAAALAPSPTPDAASSSPAITNTTDYAIGNSTQVVTVLAHPTQATSVSEPRKDGTSASTENSTESSSSATILNGQGYWIMTSVLIPTIFL